MAQNNNELIPKKAIDGVTTANKAIISLDESTLKFVKSIELLNKELKKGNITLEQVAKAQKQTAKNTTKLTELEKEEARAKKAQEAENRKQIKTLARLQAKEKAHQEALKLVVKTEDDLIRKTNALVKVRKNLDQTTDSGRRKHKALTTEIKKNTLALKGQDSQIKRNFRNVGNYTGKLKAMAMQFAGALGLTSAIYLFIGALKNTFNRIKQFDKAMQNLAGITGTSRQNLSDIEAEIKKVAATSIKTSNEVAKLAEVLFTLGKTREEVKLMLKPVNDLSIAMQATSDETADFLGQTLNAFGKSAESSQEFADIIANVRTSTALDFQRLREALSYIAPAANALGLTIGETSAIIGVLQDNGINAARAGALMTTSFARLVGKGLTLNDALQQINGSTDKVNTASDLFGKRAFTLGLILADNTRKTKRLADEFDNLSEGSLKKLTDEQLLSLDAKIKILNSSWENFILNIENGTGVFGRFFSVAIKETTKFINFLDNINGKEEEITKLTQEQAEKRIQILETQKLEYNRQIKEIVDSYKAFYGVDEVSWDELLKTKDAAQLKHLDGLLGKVENELIQQNNLIQEYADEEIEIAEEAAKEIAKTKKAIFDPTDLGNKEVERMIALTAQRLTALQAMTDTEVSEEAKQALIDDLAFSMDIYDEDVENFIAAEERKTWATLTEDEKRKAIIQASLQSLNALNDAIFQNKSTKLAQESTDLAKQKQFELDLNVGNQDKINKVNEKYDKKEAELKTKKAKADKEQALFSILISTAQAIASASPVVPLMIFAGVVGAIQAAIVGSQPIPQFFKGTESAPAGPISVAEKGFEIAEKNGKRVMFNSPTITSGMEGAKIYTHEESKKMLTNNRASVIDISELSTKQDETNELLGNLAVSHNGRLIHLNKSKTTFDV